MKIPGLQEDIQTRLDQVVVEIAYILDEFFPEFRQSYKDNFEERLYSTLYLELIHAGFFKNDR